MSVPISAPSGVESVEWRERRRVLVGKVNTCPVCDAANVVEVENVAHHGSVILVCRSCMVCESAWTDHYHLAACSLDSVEDVEYGTYDGYEEDIEAVRS